MTQYQMGWTGTAEQWQCGGTAGVKQRALTFNDRECSVGYIQNHIFHRTACIIYAYGIKGYTSASDTELAQAIELAALSELVKSLPQGLDTPVGERGTSLSGGQRQRVAIARAFLKDAPVLILDEATSHLDAISEQGVRKALDQLKTDRTTIIIAHRLSTIRDADMIVVLEDGQVVETGTHEDLLNNRRLYARLVSHQLGGARATQAVSA